VAAVDMLKKNHKTNSEVIMRKYEERQNRRVARVAKLFRAGYITNLQAIKYLRSATSSGVAAQFLFEKVCNWK
jgi:hypothetical protein